MHDFLDMCGCGGCGCEHDTSPKMPLIGDAAPEFTAMTTNGIINFPSDYAGKWVILFSHPSDFTPVCTSEFMAFQAMAAELAELNTELVGLSVGSVSSHLAWIDAIKDIEWAGMKNTEITFPVIDDIGMRVAKLYGMIHPNMSDTHAVRAVFIIDPRGIIRAILYYPASTGRNMDEIVRMVIALQTSDAFKVSTPANWLPGDDVLIGAPTTSIDMRRRISGGKDDSRAWFLTFKKLDENDIAARLTKKASVSKKTKK